MSKEDLAKYGLGIDDAEDYEFEDEDAGNEFVPDDDGEEVITIEPETVEEEEAPTEEEAPAEEEDAPTEEEEEPAPEPEPEPAAKVDNKMVPRDRLNKEIAKRRELEAQLAAERAAKVAQQQQVEAPKLDKNQLKTALENVLDGKTDDAAEALAALLGPVAAAKAEKMDETQLASLVNQALAQRELDAVVTEVVTKNPWMNDADEETFDADAAEEVLVWRDSYIRRGISAPEAIRKAVDRVATEYGYKEAEKTPPPAKAPAAKLKPADIAKKTELAKKAPAAIPKTTAPRTDATMSVADMSDDDFEKLSGAALARARGDIL